MAAVDTTAKVPHLTKEEEEELVIDHGEGYKGSEGLRYYQKVALRLIEHLMAGYFFYKASFVGTFSWPLAILAFLAGNIFADVISVIVHFTLDNYFSATTPVVGSTVHYFREHHVYPTRMVGKSFIDTNSEICNTGIVLCTGIFGLQTLFPSLNSFFWNHTLGWTAFLCTLINTVHCYTHMPMSKTPWFYRKLALDIPFFVHPDHHKTHHESLNSHYSLYMGKMDVLFDMLYVLESIEIFIFAVGGIIPEAGRSGKYVNMKEHVSKSLFSRVAAVINDLKVYHTTRK